MTPVRVAFAAGLIGLVAGTVGGAAVLHDANTVSAAAATVEAAAVVGALWLARRQLEEVSETRKDQARAYVAIFFDQADDLRSFPSIVIENFGSTAAYDVRVAFDPPLRASGDDKTGYPLAAAGMFRGIPTLAPSMRFATMFDYVVERPKDWEKTYEATVTYSDRDGVEHADRFVLDLATYEGATYIDRKGAHDIHEQLKGLREELKRMRTGFGTPMPVVVEERAALIARRRKERDEHEEQVQRASAERAEREARAGEPVEDEKGDPSE